MKTFDEVLDIISDKKNSKENIYSFIAKNASLIKEVVENKDTVKFIYTGMKSQGLEDILVKCPELIYFMSTLLGMGVVLGIEMEKSGEEITIQ